MDATTTSTTGARLRLRISAGSIASSSLRITLSYNYAEIVEQSRLVVDTRTQRV